MGQVKYSELQLLMLCELVIAVWRDSSGTRFENRGVGLLRGEGHGEFEI
jgi:hypothetical protein